jgi:hypothetical protein
MSMTPVLGRPGVRAASTAVQGFISRDGQIGYWPRGAILDGAKTRDPGNTANILALRPGLALGKVTASGKLATAFLDLTAGALAGNGTSLSLSVAGAAELYRRVGATGTFNLIGPPTAAGTVRTKTVTYSAINLGTGAVTITAVGVSDVWTLTAPAGTDAGFYQLRVTTGKGTSAEVSATTAALAANANTATVDAALEALANVGASGVVAVYADPTLTLTFASNLGPVEVEVVSDTTNDGGAFEGGWVAVHTTTGVDGRFVTSSIVTDTDGSGTPVTFVADGTGILMASDSRDIEMPRVPCSLIVDTDQFINYPADASLKAWVRNAMSTLPGGKFIFSDAFP